MELRNKTCKQQGLISTVQPAWEMGVPKQQSQLSEPQDLGVTSGPS